MSDITKLVLKKDGLHAVRWIPPIFREEPKSKEEENKLITIDEDFFDKLNEESKKNIIKEGYYEVAPVVLEDEFDIFSHLRRVCDIDSNVTLRDIMNFVRSNKLLESFIGAYSWANEIKEYHELLDKEPSVSENVKELQISWTTDEVVEYENPKRKDLEIEKPSFVLNHDFCGIGPAGEEAEHWGGDPNENIRFSISGNIDDFLDIPLKINQESLEYRKIFFPQEGGVKTTTILKGEADFALLDILDAIYWDITFYGSPSDSKKFHDDLAERADIAKELLEKEKNENEKQ